MNHLITGRISCAVTLLLLIILLCPASVQAQPMQDWGIDNVRLPWRQGNDGMASGGACYGMVRAKLEYHRLGLHKIRPFNKITTPPKEGAPGAESERLFIEQFAALAQSYTLRNRNYAKEVYTKTADPSQVDRSLAASGVSETSPQILIFSNEKGVAKDKNDPAVPESNKRTFQAHAVLVEGRSEDANYIRYTIADPNQNGVRREILYEKRTGTFLGISGFDTVRHDATPLPPQNQRWMEALLRGAMQPEKERYLPVWRGEKDVPLSPEEYRNRKGTRVEPPAPSTNLNGKLSALDPDAVGGVRLYFDPAIVADTDQLSVRWDMVRELTEQISDGKTNILVRVGGDTALEAVRLSRVLARGDDTVGGLTRILGCARERATGEIYLLGRRDPNDDAIPLDVLTVALRAVWKAKRAPAISLDPDPEDIYGLQRVRVEELPEEDKKTAFVQIMLEADYAMKRIMLGEDALEIPGFASHYALLAANPDAAQAEYFRFWLSPKGDAGADAYHIAADGFDVWYFDSDVKVLTETMKRAQAMMIGTGGADPLAERAAALFTQYYPRIEAARPVFRALHGVFDTSKLAAVLRAQGVTNPILDATANRPVAAVAIPVSYAGIGPRFVTTGTQEGITLFVGGGVMTQARLSTEDIVSVAAPAIRREGDAWIVRLPVVLPLDPQQALRVDAELEAGRALEEMMANRLDSALERVNRILASEPAHAQARVVRALVYLFRGNNTLALQDINAGMAGEPALRVLRGRIRLHAGDEPGALQDARAAIQSYPDRPDVLMQYAWVLINAGQWNEAETALARLAKLAPMDAEADVLRKQMRVLRRMPVAQAQAYQRAQLSLPLTLALDFAAVKQQMTAGDIEGALTRMRSILAYVETQRNAGVDPLYVEERCWLLIATLRLSRYAPDDVPVGISFLEKLAKRHPDWPSVLCLRITLDRSLTLARAVALYKQAVALPGTKDIFLLETRVLQDMDLRGQVGLLLIQSAGERMDSKPNEKDVMLMRELAESVTSFMPEGPARHLLALVKEAIRVTELEIAGNTAPEEIDGLQRAMADQLVRIQPPGAKSDGLNLLVMQTMFLPLFHSHVENAAETKDLALTDRFFTSVARALNSDWNDTATLEKAAEHLMAVHLLYGKIIALRVVETPAYRQLLEQRRKEEVGIAEAVEMLNIARDQAIVQAPDLPEYMRRYLRIAFTLNYSALLPDDDTAAVATALAPRETREINALCESAASLVELKAARLIIEQAGLLLSSWNPESHVIKQLLVDTHRRGRKLDAQFLAKIARP